jgi:hypothetical protein
MPPTARPAALITGAMFAGRRRVVTGLGNRLATAAVGFAPRGLVLRLAKKALR